MIPQLSIFIKFSILNCWELNKIPHKFIINSKTFSYVRSTILNTVNSTPLETDNLSDKLYFVCNYPLMLVNCRF